jgi:hypothetical protein
MTPSRVKKLAQVVSCQLKLVCGDNQWHGINNWLLPVQTAGKNSAVLCQSQKPSHDVRSCYKSNILCPMTYDIKLQDVLAGKQA